MTPLGELTLQVFDSIDSGCQLELSNWNIVSFSLGILSDSASSGVSIAYAYIFLGVPFVLRIHLLKDLYYNIFTLKFGGLVDQMDF